jgi:hypothetical protein
MSTLPPSAWATVNRCLGVPGRMLSGSKTVPAHREGHKIYWNACVFAEIEVPRDKLHKILPRRYTYPSIWFGDLDLNTDLADVQAIADELNLALWVTPESPYRFDGFEKGQRADLRDRAVPVIPGAS